MSSIPSQAAPPNCQDSQVENEAPQKVKRRRTAKDAPRKRAARACDQCRRLKEKCEGGVPCRRCTHFQRPCEFKDALQSDGDFVNTELFERMAYMERILKHKLGGISLDTSTLSRMADAVTELEDDEEDHAAGLSPQEEAELAIEDEVCTIDPVEDTTTHFSGEFSYWNFSMRIKRVIEDRTAVSLAQQSQGHDQNWNYWRAKQLRSASNTIAGAMSCIPPRHIADFLVRIFFKYAETRYFYVEKAWLLDKINILYTDTLEFGMKDAATVSIILTIFAIGTQYAYLDSPNHDAAGNNPGPGFSEDELGAMFYREAIRLLPEIIEVSSLESVQACLLFAAYSLPIDAAGLGYIYLNLTIRLAMQNGMHRKYTGDAFSAAMIETRNRVWWTAYTLERKISIFHGRPLAMLRSDVDTQLPNHRDDMSPAATFSYMVASIYLTQRMEEFFDEISQLRNCQKQCLSKILSQLVTKKNQLEAWWSTLPDEVRDDGHQHDAQFRSMMHLRLEYYLVRMFIGRPFLFNRVAAQSEPNTPEGLSRGDSKTPTDSAVRQKSYRQDLVECCINTAKEALEVCRALRDSGPGLARASYIEYSSCRAALLVLIAYSIQNQSNQFRQSLRDGLDMIREMSASGDSARSEVLLIEALERALARLHFFNTKQDRGEETTPLAPAAFASDYESFKSWESMWNGDSNNTSSDNTASQNNNSHNFRFLAAAQRSISVGGQQQQQQQQQHRHQGMGRDSQDGSMIEALNPSEDDAAFSTVPDNDTNMNPLRPFYSAAELALFSGGFIPASSSTAMHPETQVLDEFLSISDPRLYAGLGIGGGMGSVDPTGVPFGDKGL